MSLLMVLSLVLFAALIVRTACMPSRLQEKISLGLFFILYTEIAIGAYLWSQAPKEIQVLHYFLFAAGSLWFTVEVLGYFLKKSGFLTENLRLFKKHRKGVYQEIILACQSLADSRLGALMIIERKRPLGAWARKGIPVDALITKELIYSIFTPPGALHDGAALFQKDRLAACAVIIPLSTNPRLPKDLGTRHRAAVGFSEISDGLCLIVSEETGSISLADRGVLNYDIPLPLLPDALERALRFKRQKHKGIPRREAAAV